MKAGDINEINSKLANADAQDLKEVMSILVKRYHEDKRHDINVKKVLEEALVSTESMIGELKEKLSVASEEVSRNRKEKRSLEEENDHLFSKVSKMQRDAQLTVKLYQEEIESLKNQANGLMNSLITEKEIQDQIEAAREQARLETQKAIKFAQTARDAKKNSLRMMKMDLMALKRKNNAIQNEKSDGEKQILAAENRVKLIEKEQVKALEDQAARLALQYAKEIEVLKVDAERFHREALANLRGGQIRERKRLEAEKRDISETMNYREATVVNELEKKSKELTKMQAKSEELQFETSISYEIKVRSLAQKVNRNKEEIELAIFEIKKKYESIIKEVDEELESFKATRGALHESILSQLTAERDQDLEKLASIALDDLALTVDDSSCLNEINIDKILEDVKNMTEIPEETAEGDGANDFTDVADKMVEVDSTDSSTAGSLQPATSPIARTQTADLPSTGISARVSTTNPSASNPLPPRRQQRDYSGMGDLSDLLHEQKLLAAKTLTKHGSENAHLAAGWKKQNFEGHESESGGVEGRSRNDKRRRSFSHSGEYHSSGDNASPSKVHLPMLAVNNYDKSTSNRTTPIRSRVNAKH